MAPSQSKEFSSFSWHQILFSVRFFSCGKIRCTHLRVRWKKGEMKKLVEWIFVPNVLYFRWQGLGPKSCVWCPSHRTLQPEQVESFEQERVVSTLAISFLFGVLTLKSCHVNLCTNIICTKNQHLLHFLCYSLSPLFPVVSWSEVSHWRYFLAIYILYISLHIHICIRQPD